MNSYLEAVFGLRPEMRRAFIMVQDVVMVLVAVALSLVLSRSNLSFDPLSNQGLGTWGGIVVISHFLFRYCGLYKTVWRFASTPDFFNILKSCAILTLALYATSMLARSFQPVQGLNERQFFMARERIEAYLSAMKYKSQPRGFSGPELEALGARRADLEKVM